ncbi:MAG: hypothetical protein ACR2NR_10560 [Solirubrobacteraceae bacterium]
MSEQPITVLGYTDVALLVVAAPIMLLIGVSASGYGIAAGAWVALRALGVAVDRYASSAREANRQIGVRMGYMLGRLFTLAIVVILVRKSDGQGAGLAALAVIVFAFTVQLVTSAFTRPRRTTAPRPPAARRTRSR